MKRYKIEQIGDIYHSFFTLTVFSGKRKLKFVLDSGCMSNAIYPQALDGCEYVQTDYSEEITGITGDSYESKIVLLNISFEKGVEPINLSVGLMGENAVNLTIHNCVGLLGAQFMQCCKIDFRNLWLEVPEKGGTLSLLKIGGRVCHHLQNISK